MSKDKEIKQEQEIEKEIEKTEDKSIELLKKIESLEAQLASNVEKINSYEKSISIMNNEYANKIKEKAEHANRIVNEKINEITSKHSSDINNIKKYALEKDAVKLIDIITQFNTAISYPVSDEKIQKYQNGFKMFNTMFNNLLNDLNIKEIKVNVGDEYDSNIMDAFDTIEDPNLKDNQVGQVISNAYKLHDRIVKLAIVKVVKN